MSRKRNQKRENLANAEKQDKTRVDRALHWFKDNPIISALLIVGIIILAIASFTGAVKNIVQDIVSVFPSSKYKDAPTQKELEEWAKAIKQKDGVQQKNDGVLKLDPKLQEANDEIRFVYNSFLSSLRGALKAYQKSESANVYIQILDLPAILLAPTASEYSAGAIFSKNAAWSLFLKSQTNPEEVTSPVLELHFMNGDGHTVSGSGIGEVKFWYDIRTKNINISSTGVGLEAMGESQQRIPISEFENASVAITKLLLEYQVGRL